MSPSPDFLRNIRVRKLLSQERLAKNAHVNRQVIALLEAGKEAPTPRLETIRKVSEALGVEPGEVIEFRRALEQHGLREQTEERSEEPPMSAHYVVDGSRPSFDSRTRFERGLGPAIPY